jgi:uncharacterized protein YndB with AHSA1/START domain
VTASSDREIVISRVLDAPRTLVFDVWTDPKHVAEWYGPRGFTITTLNGKTLLTMRSLFESAAARDWVVKEHHAIEGGNQTLDRLQEHLATVDRRTS